MLNGGQYTGFVDNAGTFKIYVESAGSYKLDVVNTHYTFEPVVVEITEPSSSEGESTGRKEKALIRPYLYNIKSGKGQRLVYPL